MKTAVIANPHSSSGRTGKRLPRIQAALEARLERLRKLHASFSEEPDRKRIRQDLEKRLSSLKDDRVRASETLAGPTVRFDGDRDAAVEAVGQALYAAKLVSYAQGFMLMSAASRENEWSLDHGAVAKLWRGGCIIRSRFLDDIARAFEQAPDLPSLLLDDFFREAVDQAQPAWRRVVSPPLRSVSSWPVRRSRARVN